MRGYFEQHPRVRRTLLGLCAVSAIAVGAQLVYPADRALPFAKVNGTNAGFADAEALKETLKDTAKQPLVLTWAKKQ